tara:strand:- start:337 stop:561 length:225 start_codon:yes stop_codon:yes gene_type:complete
MHRAIFSSKHKTWCYRQGFYQYEKLKKTSHYAPLICKFIDVPVANEEFAKKHGAEWDQNEKKWVIFKKFKLNKK